MVGPKEPDDRTLMQTCKNRSRRQTAVRLGQILLKILPKSETRQAERGAKGTANLDEILPPGFEGRVQVKKITEDGVIVLVVPDSSDRYMLSTVHKKYILGKLKTVVGLKGVTRVEFRTS